MTGVDIVGALLLGYTPLLAKVPADRIKEELLPDGVALPAVLVRDVSSVERQHLVRGATVRTTDRVAVTVRARNLIERAEIIKLVVDCCAGRVGSGVSILTAGRGPGIPGPAMSFEQTMDFRVSYDAGAVAGAPVPQISVGPAGQSIEELVDSTSDGLALVGGDLRLDVESLPPAP